MADKQHEGDAMMQATIAPAVPAGETLQGVVLANQQGVFSAKLYAVGVTERHLLMQAVDRKMRAVAPPLVLRADELDVGNVFQEGAGLGGFGQKGQEIRFTARGEKYKLMTLGGNLLENALASDGQRAGLGALAEFLRAAKR